MHYDIMHHAGCSRISNLEAPSSPVPATHDEYAHGYVVPYTVRTWSKVFPSVVFFRSENRRLLRAQHSIP